MNNRRKQLMLASAREYCKCVVDGKTIKYNQIAKPSTTSGGSFYGLTYGSNENTQKITISGTSTTIDGDPNIYDIFSSAYNLKSNHKYIIHSTSNNFFGWVIDYGSGTIFGLDGNNAIFTPTIVAYYYIIIRPTDISNFGGKTFNETFYIYLIDLTELGLDSIANADQFFATDLGKYIAKGNYLPYETEGKFIHAQSPINFKGVNIWNEQWQGGAIWYHGTKIESSSYANYICCQTKIKVRPNTQYFYHCGTNRTNDYIQLEYLDKDSNYISREIKNDNSSFITPINCYYIVFYINNTYGGTYHYDICINEYNENYNVKYYKYCGNSVFESGLALYKGDKYKTYDIDEISYNNLIPNANQDYVNSNTDTRASIILSVYDYTNNVGIFSEQISINGFYEFTFTSNTTTNGAKIYNNGVSINQDFTENISLTNGHLYYLSLKLISCNANVVDGLRIANLRLIDLTELGLSALTDKLRIFLQKNYKLPFTLVNKTIKDQIVRTFKEVDLSSLTWTYNTYINAWQSDLSSLFVKSYASNVLPSAIAEKYRTIKYRDFSNAVEGDMWLFSIKPTLEIKTSDSVNVPSGKALLELETHEINVWYHLEINDYHEFEQYSGSVYKLDRDLSDLNVYDITADLGTNQGGLLFLIGRGNYNDYCYENGYIYVKSDDIENAWEFDLLINNLPTRMVSRRTINVESENEIDLDFTKE